MSTRYYGRLDSERGWLDRVEDRETGVSMRLIACTHKQWTENRSTWIETCSDCGAWRDRANAPAISWAWRDPITDKPLLGQPE
jgi:hypothetical protein